MTPPIGAGKCGRFAAPVQETLLASPPDEAWPHQNLKGNLSCRPWERRWDWNPGHPENLNAPTKEPQN
jgi:hypothetical protein